MSFSENSVRTSNYKCLIFYFFFNFLLFCFSYFEAQLSTYLGFPGDDSGKRSARQGGRWKRCMFHPWTRKQLPTPVFLPGKFQGQRSLGLQSQTEHTLSLGLQSQTEHTCKAHTHLGFSILQLNPLALLCPSSSLKWPLFWNIIFTIVIYPLQHYV